MDRQLLTKKYGAPVRASAAGDRPFAEFALRDGTLRLALDEERSGGDVHRSWRLRFEPTDLSLEAVLEESALACLGNVDDLTAEVVVLSRQTGLRRVALIIAEGKVREIVWANLDTG